MMEPFSTISKVVLKFDLHKMMPLKKKRGRALSNDRVRIIFLWRQCSVSDPRKWKSEEIWGRVFVTIKTPPQRRIAFCGILLKQYPTEILNWIEITMPISYSWRKVNTNWAAKKNKSEMNWDHSDNFEKGVYEADVITAVLQRSTPQPNNITQVCYRGLGLLWLSGWRRSIRIFWDKKIINEKYWKKDARRQW